MDGIVIAPDGAVSLVTDDMPGRAAVTRPDYASLPHMDISAPPEGWHMAQAEWDAFLDEAGALPRPDVFGLFALLVTDLVICHDVHPVTAQEAVLDLTNRVITRYQARQAEAALSA